MSNLRLFILPKIRSPIIHFQANILLQVRILPGDNPILTHTPQSKTQSGKPAQRTSQKRVQDAHKRHCPGWMNAIHSKPRGSRTQEKPYP